MRVLGHRGASRAAPENTPGAFALADQMGADGVELDVRLAPGGVLVVAHDPLPASTPIDLPTLSDVLHACGERMLVNVEIKNDPADADYDPTLAVVEPVVDELRRWGPVHRDRWLISSFSWDVIERCRHVAPDVDTAFLCSDLDRDTIVRTARAGHAAVHPWEGVLTEELVAQCHAAGLIVNTWTCNDMDRLAQLDEIGVDGVCTDVPDEAVARLGRSDPDPSPRWGRRR